MRSCSNMRVDAAWFETRRSPRGLWNALLGRIARFLQVGCVLADKGKRFRGNN